MGFEDLLDSSMHRVSPVCAQIVCDSTLREVLEGLCNSRSAELSGDDNFRCKSTPFLHVVPECFAYIDIAPAFDRVKVIAFAAGFQ